MNLGEFLSFIRWKLYTSYKKLYIRDWGLKGFVKFPMYVTGRNFIKIGNNFSCQRRVRLEAIPTSGFKFDKPLICIGNNVSINWDCHIGAINGISIGDNVLIGSKVLIIDHQHGHIDNTDLHLPPVMRQLWSKGPIVIERNVWIGEGVCIMPNVRIGENSIIGANSVVTKDIPNNCMAAGIPAKVIKYFANE